MLAEFLEVADELTHAEHVIHSSDHPRSSVEVVAAFESVDRAMRRARIAHTLRTEVSDRETRSDRWFFELLLDHLRELTALLEEADQ